MGSTTGIFWKTSQGQTVQPWQNRDWKPTPVQMQNLYSRLKTGQLILKQGSQGLDVALLQYRLKQFLKERTLGLTQIQVDGRFGPGTKSVVETFQKFINQNVSCDNQSCLTVDGVVGSGVAIHLENVFPQSPQAR
jgi:peptidoglycan hydrolase-like protein with peptidoglycan-binding domain